MVTGSLSKESFKAIAIHLKGYLEKNYVISVSGSEALKFDGRTMGRQPFIKLVTKTILDDLKTYIGVGNYYNLLGDIQKEMHADPETCLKEVATRFYTALLREKIEAKRIEENRPKFAYDELRNFDWSPYLPIIDIKTNQKAMYHKELKIIDNRVSYEGWHNFVLSRPSEERKALMESTFSADIEYNPLLEVQRVIKKWDGEREYTYLNIHNKPRWRTEGIGKGKPLPEDFKRLMEHLFPNELCREYVYFWMHTMLTKVNATYLLLHGEQGIGKNTLVYIMRELVGVHNYVLISTDFWESRFNGELLYKRLAFFDETIVNEDNIQKIKTLTNSTLSIERKNCEPVNVQNFCSYVITNNLDKVNHITYDDRRYSVPVLTEKRLVDAFDQVWIDDMYNRVETDEEFIGAIGHWLIENGNSDKFKSTQPYKSDYFFQIVEKALKVWQRALIELIESGEYDEIPISSIQDILKGTGSPKIQGFLTSHRDKDGDYYGHVGRHFKGERFIKVAPKYNVNGDTTISKAYEKHKVIKLDVESEIDDLEF